MVSYLLGLTVKNYLQGSKPLTPEAASPPPPGIKLIALKDKFYHRRDGNHITLTKGQIYTFTSTDGGHLRIDELDFYWMVNRFAIYFLEKDFYRGVIT